MYCIVNVVFQLNTLENIGLPVSIAGVPAGDVVPGHVAPLVPSTDAGLDSSFLVTLVQLIHSHWG